MPKQTFITRYLLIINKLKSPSTFEQIQVYLKTQSERRGLNYSLEKRTFQRELNEIRDLFGVDIVYDRSQKVYRINETYDIPEQSKRLMEAYETLELVKLSAEHANIIFFEKRTADGLHLFYDLLSAIKNHRVITISYGKFYEDDACLRTLHPLALKESRGRWYLIANSTDNEFAVPYGLDRIEWVNVENKKFKPLGTNVEALFEHSFGIIRSDKVEKVVLSFTPWQAAYIKTYPLHSSQTPKQDDNKAYVIELNIYVTHDFIMELLSFGSEVQVVKPTSLKELIKEAHIKAATAYSE